MTAEEIRTRRADLQREYDGLYQASGAGYIKTIISRHGGDTEDRPCDDELAMKASAQRLIKAKLDALDRMTPDKPKVEVDQNPTRVLARPTPRREPPPPRQTEPAKRGSSASVWTLALTVLGITLASVSFVLGWWPFNATNTEEMVEVTKKPERKRATATPKSVTEPANTLPGDDVTPATVQPGAKEEPPIAEKKPAARRRLVDRVKR